MDANLKSKIYDSLMGEWFTTEEDIENKLTELIGSKTHCYDTKIDEGLDDGEDEYLMMSAFEVDGIGESIRIYYGNITEEITHIDIR